MACNPARLFAACAILLAVPGSAGAQQMATDDGQPRPPPDRPEDPAPYHFSDELGGFAIVSLGGIGTRDDPVRISQIVATASPVTMVIRATAPINPFGLPGPYATGIIHIELDMVNETGAPWIGLELELQEHFTRPSEYGDGLSFDQRRQEEISAYSSAFGNARYDFEPYDRLLFDEGALDVRARGRFRFLVTDMTPGPTFYIKIDPRIPAS